MKTKIVYVLVSEETDYYYEMVVLSHYSLRLYHPKEDTVVELVMDEATHQRLVDKRATILDDVTPIVVPTPPEYTKMQRSRYLKTSLRQIVKGDFLYLDCDTIIYNVLSDIDVIEADIAMVSDGNEGLCHRNSLSVEYCENAGFLNLDGQPYYNSGVFFTKESVLANRFFEVWHQQWKQSTTNGVPQDQPALCQANMILNHPIQELPAIWNSMRIPKEYFTKIKIRHYFKGIRSTLRSMIFNYIKQTGDVGELHNMISHPYTICESVFILPDERTIRYLCSEMLYIYESSPKLYYFFIKINHFIAEIYLALSRLISYLK